MYDVMPPLGFCREPYVGKTGLCYRTVIIASLDMMTRIKLEGVGLSRMGTLTSYFTSVKREQRPDDG